MKDINIIRKFKKENYKPGKGFYGGENIYSFTRPEGSNYIKIFKFILDEKFVTKHEIFEKFYHGRDVIERGFLCGLYTSAQYHGILQRYRYGRKIYYSLTEKGKALVEKVYGKQHIKDYAKEAKTIKDDTKVYNNLNIGTFSVKANHANAEWRTPVEVKLDKIISLLEEQNRILRKVFNTNEKDGILFTERD